jgi:competence protein ComFB
MRIHNLMLDLVSQKLEEYEAGLAPESKIDEASHFDILCYVLNRISPLYVVSGRGFAYTENQDYAERYQRLADISILIHEGHQVVQRKRQERTLTSTEENLSGPWFNFPNIIGRLLYAENFSPVDTGKVFLFYQRELMKVMDPNWQNPYQMVSNTAGTYLFWPYPIRAEKVGDVKNFELEIRVEHPNYEPLRYAFALQLVAEEDFVDFARITTSHRIKDLYLLPRE